MNKKRGASASLVKTIFLSNHVPRPFLKMTDDIQRYNGKHFSEKTQLKLRYRQIVMRPYYLPQQQNRP